MDEDHVPLPLTWTWTFVPVSASFTCGADQTNQWTKDREGIVEKEVSGIAEATMHHPPSSNAITKESPGEEQENRAVCEDRTIG